MAVSREVASYQGQQEIVDAINGFTLSGVAQKAVWFDSVSSMQRADIPAGATAATRGYTTVNDGGNAFYYIREKAVSDVEDGGSIIFLDNENVAELITDVTINVKQFGAKGDGVADDTNAFKKATAFAESTWNGTNADHPLPVIYAPTGVYKLTDTWKISYPCIVEVLGDIVYDGEHDRPCIDIGGVTAAHFMVGSQFRFQTVAELSAYESAYFTGGTHYFSDDAFIGIKTTNLGYCEISFKTIANFAVGFVALADNAGWFYNKVNGELIVNCQESFRIEASGTGWPNGNKVSDISFNTSSDITNNYTFYNVRTVHSNGSTYHMNSWDFENFKFENHSTGNYYCIYLECCNNFKFRNYRSEVTNNTAVNFCTVDCTIVGTYSCYGILLDTNQADTGSINFINIPASGGGQHSLYEICRRAKDVYHLIDANSFNKFKSTIKQITSNKALSAEYRTVQWVYSTDFNNMDGTIGSLDPLYASNNMRSDTICFIVKIPTVNTSFKVECDGTIQLKPLKADLTQCDYAAEDGTKGLLGKFYKMRPYGDSQYCYGPNNNTVTEYYFTITDNTEIKYIALFFNGVNTGAHLSFINVYSDNIDTEVIHNLGDVVWQTATTPVLTTGFDVGDTIRKKGSATNEYWQLEKQADNSLAWVLH